MKEKVIYDFGMNNGDDLPYYLLKADRVVGVEANPKLCSLVEERFASHIRDGRLVLINCILSDKETEEKADFYIHKKSHILSQFPKPDDSLINQYEPIKLFQRTPSSIIFEHGSPHYIKIDIEHYDENVLREICEQNIRPNFISVEAHTFLVYSILKEVGYKIFNIVRGESVSSLYENSTIIDNMGNKCTYSFPNHSAGPYGVDIIKSPWIKVWQMDLYLKLIRPGWKDIHASLDDLPTDNFGWFISTVLKDIVKGSSRMIRHKLAG